MAANSIFWKLPDKFSYYSRREKKNVELQAYVVEFRRLLPLDALGFEEVSNAELLHAVVGLYDTCLPDITPEVLYSTLCGKWAKTLIFMRSLSDVINEQLHHYKKRNEIFDKTLSDSDNTKQKTNNETFSLKTEQATFLTEKHVHWEDEVNVNETEEKVSSNIEDEERSSVGSDDSDGTADNEDSSDSDSVNSKKQKQTSQKQKQKSISENALTQHEVNSSDSGVVISQHIKKEEKIMSEEKEKKEKKEKGNEEEEPGKFDGVFSDSEGDQESSDEEDDEEEDFSVGVDDFIAVAKQRKVERDTGKISKETIGIESLIVGAASYERNYGSLRDKVIQLNLLAVRKKYQKCGIGKMILNMIKDPTFTGPYDSIAVYADHSAVDFFKKNSFSDDILLNSRFSELADHWINSTLMCYLPPFTGSDISGVLRSDYEIQAMDNEIEKWREKSLDAYQAQVSCIVRMQHEIKTLKALVDTQDEVIKTLTNSRERIQKEKFRLEKKLLDVQLEKEEENVALNAAESHESDDDQFYDSLVNLLSKQHIDDVKTDHLDMEAISKGDFGDVSKEDEELLSSLIHSQSEKQLVQQIRKSLLTTGQFNNVTVDCISKVECTHISFLETSLDGRHTMPGHAPVVKQLFYCGAYTNEDSLTNITARGFTKKDFTQGMYGKGLYFTKHPSQAARFSPAGKLLLVNVNLGATESVFQQDKKRTLPPAGFDSILTPGRPSSPVSPRFTNQAEYVVFDPMKAVPIFLIEYSTTTI